MTPTAAIDMLDRQIAAHGQAVGLQKQNGDTDTTMQAIVRGYRADELAGGVVQGDTLVVVSPRKLAEAGFAGQPRRLDTVLISGRRRRVEIVDPVLIADTVVRYNLTVRG